jgi:hypothetical protein
MFRNVYLLAIVAGLMAVTTEARSDDPAREKLKEPAVKLAETASKKIEDDEAAWEKLSAELVKALDGYSPSPLNIGAEDKVLAAFRDSVKKMLDDGRTLVTLYESWTKASASLTDSMKKAPGYYREAAKLYREYAADARFAETKEQYTLVADTWEALARKAEKRVKDLDLESKPDGLVEYLKENNVFLDRFLETLQALPKTTGGNTAEYKQLVEKLRKHAEKFDGLKKNLKQFRDKVGGSAFNPAVRDAVAADKLKKPTPAGEDTPRMVVVGRRGDFATMEPRGELWVWIGNVYPLYENQNGKRVATGKIQVLSVEGQSAVVKRVSGRLTSDSFALVN